MRAGLPAGMTADSGPAQPAEFASRLARALDGEAFGMALFTELAARRADADERAALQRLAALEAHMRLALEALMERCGMPRRNTSDAAVRAADAASSISEQPWRSFLDSFGQATSRALDGYEKLRRAAPDPDAPVLLLLIDHEVALREFAERSLAGHPSPLAHMDAVIERLAATLSAQEKHPSE